MRHLIFIDDSLLRESRHVLGTKGVQETVEAGLKQAVRRHSLDELRRTFGKMDLALTSRELSRLRSER